mgnify:CR=1 FL=1
MKFFKRFFSQEEIQKQSTQAKHGASKKNSKNLDLINDSQFDLNAILEDFDVKINFLYDKISKMEAKLVKKDEEIKELRAKLKSPFDDSGEKTSIARVQAQGQKLEMADPVRIPLC